MILLAGGSGSLGRHVVARLVDRGCQVRVLTRDVDRARAALPATVEIVVGDVRDAASLRSACQGVSIVVSAVTGFAGPGGVNPVSVDRDGNMHLVSAAADVGASFVLMSVVGASAKHPMELFRMKWQAEQSLRTSGVPWTIIRSSAYLETWTTLLEQTARGSGRPVIFGRGDNPINFVPIDAVAAVVEHAVMDSSTRGEVFEVCGEEDLSLNQLATRVQNAAGRTKPPRHVPRWLLRTASVLRPIVPQVARFAEAGLAMDTLDFTARGSARAEYRQACTNGRPAQPATYQQDLLSTLRAAAAHLPGSASQRRRNDSGEVDQKTEADDRSNNRTPHRRVQPWS